MNMAKKEAQKRQLTLEMIYRAADRNNRGKVELEQLKIFIKNMRLKLTPAQLSRFLYMIDEDCTGNIYREDYYITLAAYGVNSETQWNTEGGYRTFEQK